MQKEKGTSVPFNGVWGRSSTTVDHGSRPNNNRGYSPGSTKVGSRNDSMCHRTNRLHRDFAPMSIDSCNLGVGCYIHCMVFGIHTNRHYIRQVPTCLLVQAGEIIFSYRELFICIKPPVLVLCNFFYR